MAYALHKRLLKCCTTSSYKNNVLAAVSKKEIYSGGTIVLNNFLNGYEE